MLRDQRRLLMSGSLDDDNANGLCALLMTLDGESEAPVELVVNGAGGSLDGLAAALDVVTLMRAPVDVTCRGRAVGPVAVLLATATGHRGVSEQTSVSLRLDPSTLSGSEALGSLEQRSAHHRARLDGCIGALTRKLGWEPAFIERQLHRGPLYDATEAVEVGLADAVVSGR